METKFIDSIQEECSKQKGLNQEAISLGQSANFQSPDQSFPTGNFQSKINICLEKLFAVKYRSTILLYRIYSKYWDTLSTYLIYIPYLS